MLEGVGLPTNYMEPGLRNDDLKVLCLPDEAIAAIVSHTALKCPAGTKSISYGG